MKKKLIYLLTSLLLALCFVTFAPKSASAATTSTTTTYKMLKPFQNSNYSIKAVRDKVGSRYFWGTTNSSGQYTFRFSNSSTGSGYQIAAFSSPYTDDYDSVSLVTNGQTLYYASLGNTIYKYNLNTRQKTKMSTLTSSLRSRLGVSNISIRTVAFRDNLLYLDVTSNDYDIDEEYDDGDQHIYSYNVSTKKLTRVKSGRFLTTNGRYIIYESNRLSAVYRYDMKYQTTKTIASGLVGAQAATYNSKLYLYVQTYNFSTDVLTGSFREYAYGDLTYKTVKTIVTSTSDIYPQTCYNGYIYYQLQNCDTMKWKYYKCSISSGAVTSISFNDMVNAQAKSRTPTHFYN